MESGKKRRWNKFLDFSAAKQSWEWGPSGEPGVGRVTFIDCDLFQVDGHRSGLVFGGAGFAGLKRQGGALGLLVRFVLSCFC
jgi:hypothetical protein